MPKGDEREIIGVIRRRKKVKLRVAEVKQPDALIVFFVFWILCPGVLEAQRNAWTILTNIQKDSDLIVNIYISFN